MGVNEIQFGRIGANQGLNSGLALGAQLGGMYRDNRIQDDKIDLADNQRAIDDAARDAKVALEIENPAELQAFLQRRVERIKANGGDPSDTLEMMKLPPAQLRQELQSIYEKATPASTLGKTNAVNKQFGGQVLLKDSEDNLFYGTNVNDPSTGGISPALTAVDGSGSQPVGKLSRVNLLGLTATEQVAQKGAEALATETATLGARTQLEPELEKKIALVKQEVQESGKVNAEDRSNARALETYELGIKNLAEALGATTTGPMAGWMPALTADAQAAEGTIAVMAPIMKSIFRGAGEGTFTDSDQRMLMGMLPTRGDLPEARDAKLQAIDVIVRSRLAPTTMPTNAPSAGDGSSIGRFEVKVK